MPKHSHAKLKSIKMYFFLFLADILTFLSVYLKDIDDFYMDTVVSNMRVNMDKFYLYRFMLQFFLNFIVFIFEIGSEFEYNLKKETEIK